MSRVLAPACAHSLFELVGWGTAAPDQALAVLHMLERRAGEDTFKRLLQRIVFASCHPSSAKGGSPSPLSHHP
jgi:hypothetical protein